MGSMSASDAAPLPRMGEVFFDVRGNSRTMRLSWYADTGVAVLSIWQGGMCTGTFRLAIADLPRLVETLRRGPDRQAAGPAQYPPGPDDYQTSAAAGPARYPAGPDDYQTSAAAGPARYPASPDDYQTRAASYRAGPVPYPADPVGYQTRAPGYPASPAQYPPDPPGYHSRSADYSAQVPSRRGRPAQYPAGQYDYQTSAADYPAGLPGTWGGADDGRYPGGAGPVGERDPIPAAHYSHSSSVPRRGEGPGPTAADYPAHYGTAVTDDAADGFPPESFGYGQPAANRGAVTRHARPDAPFD
jgi:hypothetical protein